MSEIQKRISELQDKGWTLAAIADGIGAAHVTLEKWKAGTRKPRLEKSVIASLDALLKKRRIPKKRRYNKNSRRREDSVIK